MANEITLSVSMQVRNGNSYESIEPGSKSITQTNVGGPSPGMVVIGTSEESVSLAELTAPGYVFFQNLDTTNYVEWGFSTGVYGGRLKAGEIAGPFRLNNSAAIYMRSNTAACKVVIKAFES